MSLEYCDKCDLMIDLDNDEHWEHFKEKWEEANKESKRIADKVDDEIFKQMKGGKNGKRKKV